MLACSGPGALDHIRRNIAISTVLHAGALVFASSPLRRSRSELQNLAGSPRTLVLAGLHPGMVGNGVLRRLRRGAPCPAVVATVICAVLSLSMWKKPAGVTHVEDHRTA